MTSKRLIIIGIFTLIISVHGLNEPENIPANWTHRLELDRGVIVKWRTCSTYLTMEMTAPTNGFVSVGFSPNGGMKGSDIVIGWVDDNGKGHIKDMHAIGNQTPLEDVDQNYDLLFSSQNETRTTIQFRRLLNTCDKSDFVIGDDTIRLIWAYNEKDPIVEDSEFKPHYHGEYRGVRRTYILNPQIPDDASLEKDIKHWDITMKNNITAEDNVYFCKIAKFPEFNKKHHMIGFQPVLFEENKYNIHHMIMYECIVPPSDGGTEKLFEEHVSSPGGRCYTPNMPPAWGKYCANIPILWTSGSEGTLAPKNVGFPLGEEHGGSTYFMFEIHYDNPQLKSFEDNSGLRIVYTDKLREHEGSMIAVGHKISPFQTVPPLMTSFTAKGYCTSECTSQAIPTEGINVFTVLLHAHYAGRKISLRHIRNGTELPILAKDDAYDYNYQQARSLPQPVKILPGDELITTCEYSTSGRNTPAFGGLGTQDEMCMSFVYYYPRISLVDCKSQPEFHSFMNALGITKVDGEILKIMNMPYTPRENQELDYPDNPFYLKNSTAALPMVGLDVMNIVEADEVISTFGTVGQVIRKKNWAEEGKTIEQKWLNGKHYAFCTGHKSKRFPLKDYIVSLPEFKAFEETKEDSCAPAAQSKCGDVII